MSRIVAASVFWFASGCAGEPAPTPQAAPVPPATADPTPPGPSAEEIAAKKAAASTEHIANATAAIKKGDATKDPLKALAFYDDAKAQLQASYDGGNPEKIKPVEKKLEKSRARSDCAVGDAARRAVVEGVLQPKFYDAGLDISARVSGKCGTTITLKYVLWTDLTVYQYNKSGQIDELGRAGFKTVKLEGWDQVWTYTF